MPISVASQRDPFRGVPPAPAKPMEVTVDATTPQGLRIPQARVLQALMPLYPEDPPSEWPLLTRSAMCIRSGYTTISGTVTRVLNGIRPGSSSGDPHLGVLARKLVEEVVLDICGVSEVNYRITASGISAYQEFINSGGVIPPVKDTSLCINDRYRNSSI
jgi:hypothetical protein